jgi:hypothetical protein
MAMLQKKDCSDAAAHRAVEVYGGDERRFGLFADICKAAVAGDAAACAGVAKLAPDQAAFCRALAAKDLSKCDAEAKGCRDRVAMIAAAAGWQVAGAKDEDINAFTRTLLQQPAPNCDEELKRGAEALVNDALKLDLQKPAKE